VKKLTVIEIVLTALFVGTLVAEVRTAAWLRSMAECDPVRQLWEARLASFGDILWFCTLIPWVAFTVIYLIVAFLQVSAWTLRKLGRKDAT